KKKKFISVVSVPYKNPCIDGRTCCISPSRRNVSVGSSVGNPPEASTEHNTAIQTCQTKLKEIKNEVIQEWQTTFDGQSTGRRFREVVKRTRCTIDVKKVKLYGIMMSFPRSVVSTLVQYRSGHTLVGSWFRMCRISEEEVYSYKCNCGDNETIHHIIIDCPIRRHLRQGLRAIPDIMDLSVLFRIKGRGGIHSEHARTYQIQIKNGEKPA
ncbi:hypothetical protein TRICI_002498, partial [Trichomonascus ciferrii]